MKIEKKLLDATIYFNVACIDRLEQKEKEGRVGWDNPENRSGFIYKIYSYDAQPTKQDLVDIANYCNFLWNLIEAQEEE